MDVSTLLSKESLRGGIIQDPELESPIMAFKTGGNDSNEEDSVDMNKTSSEQLSCVSLSRNLISNMSNEMRGSKIGENHRMTTLPWNMP